MTGCLLLQVIIASIVFAVFFENESPEKEFLMTSGIGIVIVSTGIIGGFFTKKENWKKTCQNFAVVIFLSVLSIGTIATLTGSGLLSIEKSGFNGLVIIILLFSFYGIALTIVSMIIIIPTAFLGSLLYNYFYKRFFIKDVIELK